VHRSRLSDGPDMHQSFRNWSGRFLCFTAVVATDSVLGFALEVKLLGHLCSGIVTELIKNAI